MENVAIVQPTPQLKSKEQFGARKTSQRLTQSPTSTNIDGILIEFYFKLNISMNSYKKFIFIISKFVSKFLY